VAGFSSLSRQVVSGEGSAAEVEASGKWRENMTTILEQYSYVLKDIVQRG
jgi:hypothetical protein